MFKNRIRRFLQPQVRKGSKQSDASFVEVPQSLKHQGDAEAKAQLDLYQQALVAAHHELQQQFLELLRKRAQPPR